MLYRLPRLKDEEMLRDYVQEHFDQGETVITAGFGLTDKPFGEWVESVRHAAETGDDTYGKSLLLLCFEGNRLIGLLSVRYELPQSLSERIGDIGYGVRPSERRKGYATAMLKHALDICREKGKSSVIVGCYKDNMASARIIRKNGGVFLCENDNFTKGVLSHYYVIDLQDRTITQHKEQFQN